MRFSAVNMLRHSNVEEFLADIAPDELYYLAAAHNASDDASTDSRTVLALTLDRAGKFIVATGIPRSVRDFVEVACEYLGLDAKTVVDGPSGSDSKHVRLVGNSSKIRRMAGWSPQVGWQEILCQMIDDELARAASTDNRSSGSP
jgi:GDP-D-mannose dehydratase